MQESFLPQENNQSNDNPPETIFSTRKIPRLPLILAIILSIVIYIITFGTALGAAVIVGLFLIPLSEDPAVNPLISKAIGFITMCSIAFVPFIASAAVAWAATGGSRKRTLFILAVNVLLVFFLTSSSIFNLINHFLHRF